MCAKLIDDKGGDTHRIAPVGEMKRHERPRVVPWTDMMGDQPIVGEISVPRKANIYESIPCFHTDFVDT